MCSYWWINHRRNINLGFVKHRIITYSLNFDQSKASSFTEKDKQNELFIQFQVKKVGIKISKEKICFEVFMVQGQKTNKSPTTKKKKKMLCMFCVKYLLATKFFAHFFQQCPRLLSIGLCQQSKMWGKHCTCVGQKWNILSTKDVLRKFHI